MLRTLQTFNTSIINGTRSALITAWNIQIKNAKLLSACNHITVITELHYNINTVNLLPDTITTKSIIWIPIIVWPAIQMLFTTNYLRVFRRYIKHVMPSISCTWYHMALPFCVQFNKYLNLFLRTSSNIGYCPGCLL